MFSKNTLSILCAGILGCSSLATPALASSYNTPVQQVNAIAAVVNKSVITAYQVQQAVNNVRKHMRQSHITPPPNSVIRDQVIQQLINEELQMQMVKQAGIKVSDQELDAAIANIAKSNKLTISELKKKITQQGENYNQFRQDIHKQIQISKIQREAVAGKVRVSSQEINKTLAKYNKQQSMQKSYHIADIVVALPDNADKSQIANAKNRAEDIYKKLKNGGNFSKAARLESNSSDGPNNGDLGWKTGAQLPDVFFNQLQNMKAGSISRPIQTGNGFHILKLMAMKQNDKQMTRKQAERMLQEKAFNKAVENWVKGLRKSAYIKVNP